MSKNPLHSPFLEGKKVYLRGLLEEDLTGSYFSWFNDQEVCASNNHGRFPNNTEKMRAFFERQRSSATDLVLAIIVKEGGRHIGNISLQAINWVDRCAEYAIVVGDKTSWGKGYATEASELVLKHAFHELNLNRVHCGTIEDNMAMQKLAAFMGMKQEGRRRELIFKHGKYVDLLEYGVLKSEYLKRK